MAPDALTDPPAGSARLLRQTATVRELLRQRRRQRASWRRKMTSPPSVRLVLTAKAENVSLARELLAAIADRVDVAATVEDIKAAVSEAANNVVVHAYGERSGPLEVVVRILPSALEVSVRDEGEGVASRASAEAAAGEVMAARGPGHGLGIAMMDALADHFELRPREPHGTEALLSFELRTPSGLAGAFQAGEAQLATPGADALTLLASPASLASIVLPRLACAAAARAGFTVDRVSDAQLLADALAAHAAPALSVPSLRCELRFANRELRFVVGPFAPGAARSAIADSNIGQLGPLLERLADTIEVRDTAAGEQLALVLREPAGRPSSV